MAESRGWRYWVMVVSELGKIRIALLVTMSTFAGYVLSSGTINLYALVPVSGVFFSGARFWSTKSISGAVFRWFDAEDRSSANSSRKNIGTECTVHGCFLSYPWYPRSGIRSKFNCFRSGTAYCYLVQWCVYLFKASDSLGSDSGFTHWFFTTAYWMG